MELTKLETDFDVVLQAPEFEPYRRLLHVQCSHQSALRGCITVVLQYEVNRFLSELIELDYEVLFLGDPKTTIADKLTRTLRRVIARAHAGHLIADSEMFAELQHELRAADKAFECE